MFKKINVLEEEDHKALEQIIEKDYSIKKVINEMPPKHRENDNLYNDSSESENNIQLSSKIPKLVEKSHQKNKKFIPSLNLTKIKNYQ